MIFKYNITIANHPDSIQKFVFEIFHNYILSFYDDIDGMPMSRVLYSFYHPISCLYPIDKTHYITMKSHEMPCFSSAFLPWQMIDPALRQVALTTIDLIPSSAMDGHRFLHLRSRERCRIIEILAIRMSEFK